MASYVVTMSYVGRLYVVPWDGFLFGTVQQRSKVKTMRRFWKKGDNHGKKDDDDSSSSYNEKNNYKDSILPMVNRDSPSIRRSSGGTNSSGSRQNTLYSPYNHHHQQQQHSMSRRKVRRNSSMDCLLGGHYYPNKDKKKNMCHSMASSSPVAICIIVLVLSIIIGVCILTILVLIFEIEVDTITHHHHTDEYDYQHQYSHEVVMKKKQHSLEIPKTLYNDNHNHNNNHNHNDNNNHFVHLQSLEQMYQNAQILQNKWETLLNDPIHPYNKDYNIHDISQDDDHHTTIQNNKKNNNNKDDDNSNLSNFLPEDAQQTSSEDSKDELQEATNPSRDIDIHDHNNDSAQHHNSNKHIHNNDNHKSDSAEQRMMMMMDKSSIIPLRTISNIEMHHQFSSCPSNITKNYVTLVIQSTLDRLPLLSQTCQRWKGPIILVLYFETHDTDTANQHQQEWKQSCPQSTLLPYYSNNDNNNNNKSENDERKLAYPINQLRNIGLDHVTTSHILVVDIDLIPSEDLYAIITQYIQNPKTNNNNDNDGNHLYNDKNLAIIVPAFERKMVQPPCESMEDCLLFLLKNENNIQDSNQFFLPSTFEQLRKCVIQDKECSVFQSLVNWEGHSTTNSINWLVHPQTTWYQDEEKNIKTNDNNHVDTLANDLEINFSRPIRTIECMESMRYEPYMVLPWCATDSTNDKDSPKSSIGTKVLSPYYDERFHGYGKNKIQQFAHVRLRGTTFQVLPKGFLVHMPHPESVTKQTWNDKDKYQLHLEMDQLFLKYLQELAHHYASINPNPKNILPNCQRTQEKQKQK